MLAQATGDAVTTITCLGGAIAGAASEQVATVLINAARGSMPPANGNTLGEQGLEFVARSFVSALAFNVTASYMPSTSDNIAFSILFFAAQPRLVRLAVGIAAKVVGPIASSIPLQAPPKSAAVASDCACKH